MVLCIDSSRTNDPRLIPAISTSGENGEPYIYNIYCFCGEVSNISIGYASNETFDITGICVEQHAANNANLLGYPERQSISRSWCWRGHVFLVTPCSYLVGKQEEPTREQEALPVFPRGYELLLL
jgi:hypothetical protein